MSYENEGISVKDTNNTTSSNSTSDGYVAGHFGPLAHVNTASSRYPAFGGDLQPGLYRLPKDRKIANPAPLGLCAFALTTFVLGCINMNVRGVTEPNMIVGPALAYGGLVQLCAGMWYVARHLLNMRCANDSREMAVGNTFGATVLSSYGGFWISLAITFIPGGFNIMGALEKADNGEPTMFYNSFALYLFVCDDFIQGCFEPT
jgi:succinate-acetate transporter protein